MSQTDFAESVSFREAKVAVVGLGLMGGSLALALHGHCAELIGFDPNPQVLRQALQQQVINRGSVNLREALQGADLIVMAAPVLAILDLLRNLDQLLPAPAVILDLGSTKVEIMAAMENLPKRFDPLGGHPMCGKEKASLDNAEAQLYRGAVFALTPLPRTTKRAKAIALELVAAIGARPLWVEPEQHDCWVAATSHLPYLLANALTLATPDDAAPLIGTGFLSTTRLASSYAPMMLGVLQTNRQNVLEILRVFRSRLGEFERCLENGDLATLEGLLMNSACQHQKLTSGRECD